MALDTGSIGTPADTGPSERYALSGLSFPPRSGGPLPLTKPRTATPPRGLMRTLQCILTHIKDFLKVTKVV